MAHPRPKHQNGVPNGRPQPPPPPSQDPPAFTRPFTLYEALPYTPFTSLAPFNSDIIPTPSLGLASLPAPSIADLVSTTDFDALNAEAQNQQPNSKKLEHALGQIQSLLDPKRVTQFKFKSSPKTGARPNAESKRALSTNLTPFSKMVYDQTSVSFRYPTPETPGTAAPNGHPVTPVVTKQKSPAVPKKKSPVVRKKDKVKPSPNNTVNSQAHSQNAARLEIVLPTKKQLDDAAALVSAPSNNSDALVSAQAAEPVPQLPPQLPPQSAPMLAPQTQQPKSEPASQPVSHLASVAPHITDGLIAPGAYNVTPEIVGVTSQTPSTPVRPQKTGISIELVGQASFDKHEYQAVEDSIDEPMTLSSKKRKLDDLVDSQGVFGESLGVRQRSEAALQDLQRCIQSVYDAENHLQRSQTNNDFVFVTPDNEITLTAAAQKRLHSLIEKSINLDCFKNVQLDDLLHINRMSESALKHAESLELKIDDAWGQEQAEQWLQLLPDVDTALKAARTSLRMMCGGREDKQLYSEGFIEQALNLFKNVMDGIIVPLAELRGSGSAAGIFKILSQQKERIGLIFTSFQRLFALMTTLIATIDTSEAFTNTLEFTSSRVVFLENAHTEKDSVVPVQRFDGLRLVAMDMLSQIFILNPQQRQGIFDDILTSLEKLPLGKQRARQFKLVDGTSIQPVSALIMRLVQVSAGKVDEARGFKRSTMLLSMEDGDEPVGENGKMDRGARFTVNSEEDGAAEHATSISELGQISKPLIDTANRNAQYVINFIVKRAQKSTKTGDTPYRNLLDLFVEDFTSCLNNSSWPAAELLLRRLMIMMVQLVEGEKSSAPAKNMALEVLGVVNAAISRLRSYVRKTAASLDTSNELGLFLSDLGASALELKSRPEHMVTWSGPYRATLEHLQERHIEDPNLSTAISYLISEWANKICTGYDACDEGNDERDRELGRLAYRLRMMIYDRNWLNGEYSFKTVSAMDARLSYAITLLRSQLCESFSAILNILLGSMASDQATVRSKSLKSINQVLETDPSILDGDDSVVVQMILQCSNDSSTQVRDSALGLIGKCIAMRPALEEKMTDTVIQRFIDTGPGVRKRAMKLARDIYLQNKSKIVRSAIASGLLHRMQDPEESVRDLARQLIEEIWFVPFQKGESSAEYKIHMAEHVALMVQTLKQGNIATVLDKVLQTILSPQSKTASAVMEVCTKLVESMFDMVDNADSDDTSGPSGKDALQVLMIFANADARLFTFEQIRLLKPYITSVGTSEDLALSRAVVVIYRRVLPQLSSVHSQFLSDVRKELMPSVAKVSRVLLDDIIACIWIISTLLDNSENIARMILSSLDNIRTVYKHSQKTPLTDLNMRRFERWSLLVGMAGKHCDLDGHHELFKVKFPQWSGPSVSKLMIDVVIPFTASSYSLTVRKAALDSVGLVCQSWPRNYVAPNVYTTFQRVFDEQIPALESMILRSLKEFLLIEEKRSEQAHEETAGAKSGTDTSPKKRELTVMGSTNFDDVASATTHRFLKDITRIALAAQDDHAFLAVEVLASINRQGLVHPKETGVTLITLETSSISKISEMAFIEHKALHEKHETVLEREYVKAIQSAFNYQRDVANDSHGARANPFTSKLHLLMEVLKISKTKNRQKFLEKFCAQVDFDFGKLDISEEIPTHVQFSRFLVENMAFFEYTTVGEVQATVAAMEKLVSSTGATVAHIIESDIFQVRMDAGPSSQISASGEPLPATTPISLQRLRQLTASSMILLSLWEGRTFLRRLYSMGTTRREPKAKSQTKDLTKAPVKAQGVNGDKFWDDVGFIMTALTSRERMTETCKSFVELMNVDKEFKIAEEEEEMNGEDPVTPSDNGDEEAEEGTGGRGRKRKAQSNTPGSARKKQRARSSSQARKKGRPRKQSIGDIDADGEFEEDVDWF